MCHTHVILGLLARQRARAHTLIHTHETPTKEQKEGEMWREPKPHGHGWHYSLLSRV